MLGRTISRYRVVAELGQGGMGVVYKAEDTRLGRFVALKFLPEGLASDAQALDRFRREARAASALNHPHICTIHDIEEHDGQTFIVMELLEGKTLRERIAAKRLDLDAVLDLSMQVAEALGAAHAKSIVHRDIKSANIFVTDAGQAKVLDFGLAKLVAEGENAAETATGIAVPSDAVPKALVTTPGQTMGTVAYMSPEQVRGQELDARTDIFSFGVVVYEMATGRLPFQGATTGVVFDAILNRAPEPVAQLNPAAPAELGHIVDKAIEKDRELRYQSIREMRADLARLKRDTHSGSTSASARVATGAQPVAAPPKKKRAFVAAAVSAGLIAFATAAYILWPRSQPAAPASKQSALSRVTFDDGLQAQPAWSPDGRFIAYSSNQSGNFDIWVQPVGGGRAVRVTSNPAHDWQPVWSPDGNTIAFRSERDGGGIFIVPALGGNERKLSSLGYWPEWSSDGSKILVVVRPSLQSASLVVPHVYFLDPNGAAPKRALETELAQFSNVGRIMWHPDGQRISFPGAKGQQGGFWTQPIAGGPAVLSTMSEEVQGELKTQAIGIVTGRWAPAGDAIYIEGAARGVRNLWRIDVDPATLRWTGGPTRLTTGAGIDTELSISHGGDKLAFVTKTETTRLWSLPFDARTRRTAGDAAAITPANATASGFDLSANGMTLAYLLNRPGKPGMELWSTTLESGQPLLLGESLTFFSPRVSRDGTRVAVRITREGLEGRRIIWLTIGKEGERLLPAGPTNPLDWSPDGDRLIHFCLTPAKTPSLCASPVSNVNPAEFRPLVVDPDYAFWQGRYSPDGRWVLFNAQSLKQAGVSVLGVVPAEGGKWIPLTDPTLWADKARWAPDGKTIYFISNRDTAFFDVWGIEFDPAKGASPGKEFRVTRYDNPGRTIAGTGGSELGVSATRIVVPLVESSGSIWVLEGIKR